MPALESTGSSTAVNGVYWTYVEKSRLTAVLAVLPHRRFYRILDLGCGKGEFLLGLCRTIGTSSPRGVDGSPVAVAAAVANGIDATKVDLSKEPLPFRAASADLVVMIETIEHLEDVEHCLDEARRVLEPNGSLVITTPNLASWHGRLLLALGYQPLSLDVGYRKHYGSRIRLSGKSAGHIRGFTKPALSELLESSGFDVTSWSSTPAVATGDARTLSLLRWIDLMFSRFPSIGSHLVVHATRREDTSESKFGG